MSDLFDGEGAQVVETPAEEPAEARRTRRTRTTYPLSAELRAMIEAERLYARLPEGSRGDVIGLLVKIHAQRVGA